MAQAATSDSLFLLSRIFLHSRVLVSLSGGMSYLRFRITEVVAGMRMMFMIYPPAGGSRAAVFRGGGRSHCALSRPLFRADENAWK